MANLQIPFNQQYDAVLGSEYCTGYMDSLGKWNTGFYCSAKDDAGDIFCCGSSFHKYCCTKRDQLLQTQVNDLTVYVGILVGAATALLLITMVSCFCCSFCPLYKKHNTASGKYRGSQYRLHQNASRGSGMTAMYNGSNGVNRSVSPLTPKHQGGAVDDADLVLMPRSNTLPHNLSHHHSFRKPENENEKERPYRHYGTLGRLPREQPPSYHILPRASYLVLPNKPPDLLSGSQMQEDIHSISANVNTTTFSNNAVNRDEEDLYFSTKF